jgi:hypothetical protein
VLLNSRHVQGGVFCEGRYRRTLCHGRDDDTDLSLGLFVPPWGVLRDWDGRVMCAALMPFSHVCLLVCTSLIGLVRRGEGTPRVDLMRRVRTASANDGTRLCMIVCGAVKCAAN